MGSNDVTFLNDPEVQKQLGVNMKFESCNLIVNKAFTLDFMKNFHLLIPPMLSAGIDVLIYAGDMDGKVVGELQSFANFHFLRVAGAGHMVPLDQPEAALGMLNDLLAGAFLKPELEVVV